MFETFRGTILFPQKTYLLIVAAGSENSLASRTKACWWEGDQRNFSSWGGHCLVAAAWKPAYDCTLRPSAEIHTKWPSSLGVDFLKAGVGHQGCSSVLLCCDLEDTSAAASGNPSSFPVLSRSLWNAKIKVSFSLSSHFPGERMFFLSFPADLRYNWHITSHKLQVCKDRLPRW